MSENKVQLFKLSKFNGQISDKFILAYTKYMEVYTARLNFIAAIH